MNNQQKDISTLASLSLVTLKTHKQALRRLYFKITPFARE